MMDASSLLIQERLREVVQTYLQRELSTLSPETPLVELGLDSLDKVEILFEVENLFDVVIPDAAAATMHTIHDIISYIASHTQLENRSI
jgi:acyl carrier protein